MIKQVSILIQNTAIQQNCKVVYFKQQLTDFTDRFPAPLMDKLVLFLTISAQTWIDLHSSTSACIVSNPIKAIQCILQCLAENFAGLNPNLFASISVLSDILLAYLCIKHISLKGDTQANLQHTKWKRKSTIDPQGLLKIHYHLRGLWLWTTIYLTRTRYLVWR